MEDFSITEIIRDFMNKKGISQRKLSQQLNESPSNFNQKLLKNDLDINYVRKISIALDYDFFQEVSKSLPIEIRGSVRNSNYSEIEKALMRFIETNYPRIKK